MATLGQAIDTIGAKHDIIAISDVYDRAAPPRHFPDNHDPRWLIFATSHDGTLLRRFAITTDNLVFRWMSNTWTPYN